MHLKFFPTSSVLFTGTILVLLALACPHTARAQHFLPFGPIDSNPDFQIFAPAELGSFGERPKPHEGYFVSYERLYWAINAQRVPTGTGLRMRPIQHFGPGGSSDNPVLPFVDPQIVTPTEPGTPLHNGDNPDLYVHNSIGDDVPRAEFAWGNRYDLGYIVDGEGWLVSILDGLEQSQSAEYGLEGQGYDNPYGSVAIIFDFPKGLMTGFIDVIDDNQGGVNAGGNGDSFADDINRNKTFGPDGVSTATSVTVPDQFGGPVDWNDLVTFLPVWNLVTTRNVTKISGVELMKMKRFRPFHRGSVFELYYGARFFRIRDDFDVTAENFPLLGGEGSYGLGPSNWDTNVRNQIVGPQIAGRWFSKRGRWTVVTEGRFLAGLNIQDFQQRGGIAQRYAPGALNSPLYFGDVSFSHARSHREFSPVGELRLQASYTLTKAFALTIGWTGTYAGNVARANSAVRYELPNMGIDVDKTQQDLFANGVTLGFEFNR